MCGVNRGEGRVVTRGVRREDQRARTDNTWMGATSAYTRPPSYWRVFDALWMELASRRCSIRPANGDMAHWSRAVLQREVGNTSVEDRSECGSKEDGERFGRFH